MTYTAELIHLVKYMLRLRGRKDLNGYETPIIVDIEELNKKLIPDLNFLNERLLELVNEYVPVEGEGSRKTVISHLEHLEGGKMKIHGSSTDKLEYFLKKMGGTDETKAKTVLPTMQPPLPPTIAWGRIRMVVNERFEVYVFYQDEDGQEGRGHKIDFADLGMIGHSKMEPGRPWWKFVQLAQANGQYEYTKSTGSELSRKEEYSERQSKRTLTRLLKQRFELQDNPFERLDDRRYSTKFSIAYQAGFPHDMRFMDVSTESGGAYASEEEQDDDEELA